MVLEELAMTLPIGTRVKITDPWLLAKDSVNHGKTGVVAGHGSGNIFNIVAPDDWKGCEWAKPKGGIFLADDEVEVLS
jgi:hypothetical protein